MKKSSFSTFLLIFGGIGLLLVLGLSLMLSFKAQDNNTPDEPITTDTARDLVNTPAISPAIEAEIASLAMSFHNIDHDDDLQLTIEEFIRSNAQNIESTIVASEMHSDLVALYQAYDDNHDQALNPLEFTYFITTDENGDLLDGIGAFQAELNARIIFTGADDDLNEKLDIDELRNIIERTSGTRLTMADALTMIRDADQNNDGALNIAEFNILH